MSDEAPSSAVEAPHAAGAELLAERPLSVREERRSELIATIILAVATLATAWSGYQSVRWNGVQAQDYVQASTARVESTKSATKAGQLSLYDSQNFTQWLNAYASGNTQLAGMFERRFRAEFRPAFDAWMATNPFADATAPPGPMSMPQYVLADSQRATELETQATALFEAGNDANEWGDQYVLNTVFLASALFLAGISERFSWRVLRTVVLGLAGSLVVFGIFNVIRLPLD
jgi:hypothetical protein